MLSGSTGASNQDQLLRRAFLTQSAHSTGNASFATSAAGLGSRLRPATAATATTRTANFAMSVAEIDGSDLVAMSAPPWRSWRAATADESRARMALVRRDRLGESERLARLGRTSGDLRAYSRGRFQEKIGTTPAAQRCDRQTQDPSTFWTLPKTLLSPYLTLPRPESVAIDPEASYAERACCAQCRAGDAAAGEWSAGRLRAQLMSQVRLRQPLQPVRFRHDRTAQELSQEGGLPSRGLCEPPFPWQPSYQYSPFPEPQLSAWALEERARCLERLRLADEFEATGETAVEEPTPPVLLIEVTSMELPTEKQQPEEEQRPPEADTPAIGAASALTPVSLGLLGSTKGSGGSHRPRSGRSKQSGGGKRSPKQQSEQQQTAQQQQQLLLQQQKLEQLAAARRRRNFSVSTIGEEELGRSREEQQRLADICQRLRDRQAAREAEAAALKAAEEAARLALEPPPPPQPLPPPPPPESQQKPPSKSKKSPRSASVGKSKRSGSTSSGGSGGKRGKKPPSEKPSPRSKSPKAGAAGKKKVPAAAAKKKSQPQTKKKTQAAPTSPPTPPPPPPPPQPTEPLLPDAFDLLAEEIESASIFHRTKQPGELPDLPCPSSESKSRQQLTKLWWQRQEFVPPSVLA